MERSTTPTSPSSASVLDSTNSSAPSGMLKRKRVELSPSKPNAYEERMERKMKLIAEWASKASEGAAADLDQEDKVDSYDTIEKLEKIRPLVKMKNKAERELLESQRAFFRAQCRANDAQTRLSVALFDIVLEQPNYALIIFSEQIHSNMPTLIHGNLFFLV
ncbi:hypothetical protein JB92DRAFT_3130143 [Gautieria morchelliformis]|nr:hypothetical protein JB92DRAFT_3130143 [Gautieria morchelliformis]